MNPTQRVLEKAKELIKEFQLASVSDTALEHAVLNLSDAVDDWTDEGDMEDEQAPRESFHQFLINTRAAMRQRRGELREDQYRLSDEESELDNRERLVNRVLGLLRKKPDGLTPAQILADDSYESDVHKELVAQLLAWNSTYRKHT